MNILEILEKRYDELKVEWGKNHDVQKELMVKIAGLVEEAISKPEPEFHFGVRDPVYDTENQIHLFAYSADIDKSLVLTVTVNKSKIEEKEFAGENVQVRFIDGRHLNHWDRAKHGITLNRFKNRALFNKLDRIFYREKNIGALIAESKEIEEGNKKLQDFLNQISHK